jgi:hypothetical protein
MKRTPESTDPTLEALYWGLFTFLAIVGLWAAIALPLIFGSISFIGVGAAGLIAAATMSVVRSKGRRIR